MLQWNQRGGSLFRPWLMFLAAYRQIFLDSTDLGHEAPRALSPGEII